jgi:hypothetical protein
MEAVKIADGLAIADDNRAQIAALPFANRAANRTAEAPGQLLNAKAQIECMPEESYGGSAGGLKASTSADFQMLPPAFPGEANETVRYHAG